MRINASKPNAEAKGKIFSGTPIALALSSDGKILVAGSDVGEMAVIDTETNRERYAFIPCDKIISVDISPDNKYVIAGGDYISGEGNIALLDINDNTLLYMKTIDVHVSNVKYSPDGKLVAVVSLRGTKCGLHIIEPMARNIKWSIYQDYSIETISFSPDGSTLATGSEDGQIIFYDVSTGEKEDRIIKRWNSSISEIKYTQDGKKLFIMYTHKSSSSAIIELFDLVNNKKIWGTMLSDYIVTAKISNDDQYIVVAQLKGKIGIYNANTGKAVDKLNVDTTTISIAFPNDLYVKAHQDRKHTREIVFNSGINDGAVVIGAGVVMLLGLIGIRIFIEASNRSGT